MSAPDAFLLISTHCPHCSTELAVLADMIKQGLVGRLEVVNVEAHPEVAQSLGVRSVPWLKMGVIELAGLRSQVELTDWAVKAGTEAGLADYFHLLLKEGQMARVLALLHADSGQLAAVLPIIGNVDASLNVRLGAGVLLEAFAQSEALKALLPRLAELSSHADARVRADASHYLGLTGAALARPYLQALLNDDDADVREIAAESLEGLPHT